MSENHRSIGLLELTAATKESFHLWRAKKDVFYPVSALALAQLQAAFPQHIQPLLEDADNRLLVHFSDLITLGGHLNDYLDLKFYPQEQAESLTKWKRYEAKIKNEGSSEITQILENYLQETLLVENHFAINPPVDLKEACRYRELVNAIAFLHSSSILLGLEATGIQIGQNTSLEAIENKYRWLINNKFESADQQKLVGIFNLVMAMQVTDDSWDFEIDSNCGLTSIATTIASTQGSELVRPICASLRKHYLKQARNCGFTNSVVTANNYAFIGVKLLQRRYPKVFGGPREIIFNSQTSNQ